MFKPGLFGNCRGAPKRGSHLDSGSAMLQAVAQAQTSPGPRHGPVPSRGWPDVHVCVEGWELLQAEMKSGF